MHMISVSNFCSSTTVYPSYFLSMFRARIRIFIENIFGQVFAVLINIL